MNLADDGIHSEPLRAALAAALAGKPERLEELLCRFGGGPDRRPNLRLAAALGADLSALPDSAMSSAAGLLDRFGGDEAAPDSPRVFLPMAAAHGWVALLRANRDTHRAWEAVGGLAADERTPVRLAVIDALTTFAVTHPSGARALVDHALGWLDADDRDARFAAAALVIDVLGERQVGAALRDHHPQLLAYLGRVLEEITGAPRAAERLESRRRLLSALPNSLATAVVAASTGDLGPAWMESVCDQTTHPDVREALSDTLVRLRSTELEKTPRSVNACGWPWKVAPNQRAIPRGGVPGPAEARPPVAFDDLPG